MDFVLTWKTFAIVCPLIFLGGLVDSIGGGGGLITLPAYLLAGIPIHSAIATNKLSATTGTALATWRYYKNGMINLKFGLPTVLVTLIGAVLGSKLNLIADDSIMNKLLFIILPVTAFVVFNKKLFHDNPDAELQPTVKNIAIASVIGFIIGMYDGFYGPGTGTFLIILFTIFSKMSIKQANGQAKLINLTSNISSLFVYLVNGKVMILLGLAAAVCSMAGSYIGSSLVMSKGSKIVKPIILGVLLLLFLKVLGLLG